VSPRPLPVVALIGRPNVGKSTIFNRILGARRAIVEDRPGVTRDRIFAEAEWAGRHFLLVDTGGIVEGTDEPMETAVRAQALAAVAEADVLVVVVDGKAGLHPLDERLVELVRGTGRPILLVANKLDRIPHETAQHDFWSLGIGTPHALSATSGKGSGDLLDEIVALLPDEVGEGDSDDDPPLRVAVIGKPNVGKSSFVNRLFGEERSVVSPDAGTTRDPVDSELRYHGRRLVFVDTAGLRRHARIDDSVEYYSSIRTERVLREADVCLVLIDATEPVHVQDLRIGRKAWDAGLGVIFVVNKWDLVEKTHASSMEFERALRKRAPFLRDVPILFASALTGQRIRKALDLVVLIGDERLKRIATSEVNQGLEALVIRQPPPHARGRPVKIRYASQVAVAPPTFVVFSNLPKAIPESYLRYLEHGFRARWGFQGVPLRVFPRTAKSP
jgi:GTP-binding protein